MPLSGTRWQQKLVLKLGVLFFLDHKLQANNGIDLNKLHFMTLLVQLVLFITTVCFAQNVIALEIPYDDDNDNGKNNLNLSGLC